MGKLSEYVNYGGNNNKIKMLSQAINNNTRDILHDLIRVNDHGSSDNIFKGDLFIDDYLPYKLSYDNLYLSKSLYGPTNFAFQQDRIQADYIAQSTNPHYENCKRYIVFALGQGIIPRREYTVKFRVVIYKPGKIDTETTRPLGIAFRNTENYLNITDSDQGGWDETYQFQSFKRDEVNKSYTCTFTAYDTFTYMHLMLEGMYANTTLDPEGDYTIGITDFEVVGLSKDYEITSMYYSHDNGKIVKMRNPGGDIFNGADFPNHTLGRDGDLYAKLSTSSKLTGNIVQITSVSNTWTYNNDIVEDTYGYRFSFTGYNVKDTYESGQEYIVPSSVTFKIKNTPLNALYTIGLSLYYSSGTQFDDDYTCTISINGYKQNIPRRAGENLPFSVSFSNYSDSEFKISFALTDVAAFDSSSPVTVEVIALNVYYVGNYDSIWFRDNGVWLRQSESSSGSSVSITPSISTGTKIADFEIDGEPGSLYAPNGGGTTVIANPEGEATDDLTKIQIGTDIYDIVGGSGGSSYEETVIYSSNTSEATYQLSEPFTDYDAIQVFIHYTPSGSYETSAVFVTSNLASGVKYGITADQWYSYFSITDNSTLSRQDEYNSFVNKIIGLKFGGGSGENAVIELIYDASEVSSLQSSITLDKAWDGYDFIAFTTIEIYQNREYYHNYVSAVRLLEEALDSTYPNGGWIAFGMYSSVYTYGKVESTTQFTNIYGNSKKIGNIYGIKLGSSGGSSSSSYSETDLYTNSGTSRTDISLSDDYTNYDQIYFECIRVADNRNYVVPYHMLASSLTSIGHFQFFGYNEYASYDVTDSTTFTLINGSGDWYIKRVVGVKHDGGSSS